MADNFLSGLQNFKHSFSLSDIEFTNHFSGLNLTHQESSALNFHGLIGYSNDNPFPHLCTGNSENYQGLFIQDDSSSLVPPVSHHVISNENDRKDTKRKSMDISITPETSSANSSPQASENGIKKKNGSRRGKKVKIDENEEENPREVVHVRARRGQATDSHSLAERVRRGKINERLRCLQDIVPGCYKTMGMAVMLDEIINYVQSLQNQVEFLSMKLTAASTVYDFNSDIDVMETMQKAKAFETFKIQNVASQGLPSPQFAPLDLNFNYFPQLPHNR